MSRPDWAEFARWCVSRGEPALPATAQSVLDYVRELAAASRASTIERRLTAVSRAHREVGLPSPTDDPRVRIEVTRTRWLQRKLAGPTTSPAERELRTMLERVPPGLMGARDRTLLLIGLGGGLRASELVSLDVADLHEVDGGLAVELLRGRVVIPRAATPALCPVTAWQDWVSAAGLTGGPAFRAVDRHGRLGLTRLGQRSITRILRRAAARAGLDKQRSSAPA